MMGDENVNRTEFDAFVSDIRSRGFTHVRTSAGMQPIADWRPYGCFDGSNPGIEQHIARFDWYSQNQAVDVPVRDYGGPCGLWTFFDLERA